MKHLSFQQPAEYDESRVIAATPKEYYVWRAPDKPFTISVDFAVIDRLSADAMKGFGAVRRRGTECGGILLGHIDDSDNQVRITVDDFVAVPCEYAFGPSYLLSAADLANFRKALAEHDPSAEKPLYTVGFYRSNTRDELAVDDHDAKFFREYFPDPLHILLLVKPYATKAPVAGFFIQEKGKLRGEPSLEFPFRSRDLGAKRPAENDREARRHSLHSSNSSDLASNGSDLASAPPKADAARTMNEDTASVAAAPAHSTLFGTPVVAEHPSGRGLFARLGWLAVCIMLVIFGVIIGTNYTSSGSAPNTVSSATDPYALNLSVTRADDNLLVKWDRQSLAIKGAWRGVLTITEGNDSKTVQLDPANLQNGSVIYRHIAPDVSFRLEVFIKEHRSVVEDTIWRMPESGGPKPASS